jgi:hypothetical protein
MEIWSANPETDNVHFMLLYSALLVTGIEVFKVLLCLSCG